MLKKFWEKILDKIAGDLSSRKWLAFLIITTLSFVALMNKIISPEVWEVVALAGLGIFSAANVTQKVGANGKQNQIFAGNANSVSDVSGSEVFEGRIKP